MNAKRDEFEILLSKMTEGQKEQWQSIRDKRVDRMQEQRNVMLRVAMTFLGISIPLYWNCRGGNNHCLMGGAIVSAGIASLMLFIAQRKLIRQLGEAVKKYPLALIGSVEYLDSESKWYEEFCLRFWWLPFLSMVVLCFLAVFWR